MIQLMLVVLTVAIGSDQADNQRVNEPPECDSCTARHNALKKLRDLRMTPPMEDPGEEATITPGSTED